MKNKTFTHVSKASFALVVLLALQSLLIGVGANTTATPAIQKSLPDLRSELATIERYHDALVAYNNLCSQLARRSALRQGDIDPAQRKASELSGGLSGVQSAIRQIIDKFKAANAWNDLDEKLAANADAKLRPFLQGSSFRKDLEDAAAGLGGQSSEINAPLNDLRRRLTGQTFFTDRSNSVVRVAYRPPPTTFGPGLACRVGQIRVKLIHRLGGIATDQTHDRVSCNCNPQNGVGIATGRPCSQVLGSDPLQ
jgi:hypothetical protein